MNNEKLIDELFAKPDSSKKTAVILETSKLHTFKNHPYKIIDNDEMKELTESIAQYGIHSPITVRKDGDGYEVISGHRRLHAAIKAGLKEVPAIIYDIGRDEAAVMVVDSNLHREHILPSEKAAAYKLKYEALKHQGKTLSHNETKLRTDEIIANYSGESRSTVQRYIRLTELIPELINLVDDGKMAVNTAVELSFIPQEHQKYLFTLYEKDEIIPSPKQASEMKSLFQSGCLILPDMERIMKSEKPNQKPKLHIPVEKLRKYFSENDTPKSIEEYIIKLLEDDYLKRIRRIQTKSKERER